MRSNQWLWRLGFAAGGVLITVGGPQHPGGTMAEMLADPAWYPSHTLVLLGFLGIAGGLALLVPTLGGLSRRWARLALAGSILQTIEMVFHTLAAMDHGNLVAGQPTPVLSTHLFLSLVMYPLFAVTMTGFIAAAARERTVGSLWIAWLGIVGALAHGAAPLLVLIFEIEGARLLFPMVVLLAVWAVLAALWRTVSMPAPVAAVR